MKKFWYHPSEKFDIFGLSHFITIGIIILVLLLFYFYRHSLIQVRNPIRITVGSLLILSRISLDIWYLSTGHWSVTYALPLELCSIASLVCGFMLLTKNHFLFRSFYFIALAGATQAVLTPSLDFGFPQFRYIQFFTDHTLLILSPLILICLFHFKLHFRDIFYALITLNILAAFVYLFNTFFSGNYMFLMHRPKTASLLDYLGPYPYYLLSLEIVALILFTCLYYFYRLIK